MNKEEILGAVNFGRRIAEEEGDELSSYFVETDQWKRVFSGEVDIIYGPKGSGKSAIYSLILSRSNELFSRGIVVIPAENPRGTPAFKDLVADPPATEAEFRALWKIYYLSLVGEYLRSSGNPTSEGKRVVSALEEAHLLPRDESLRGRLLSAVGYARKALRAEALEGGLKINPVTGMPEGITGKVILREPDAREQELGLISADRLLEMAQGALNNSDRHVWLIVDRLDVAFAESADLEANALRGLFRVYLDVIKFDRLSLKVFLRDDIWRRIISKPFPEASHITRYMTISWTSNALLNLVVRRLLHNDAIVEHYSVDGPAVLADIKRQAEVFYRVFPAKVDTGPNKPTTFDWMLSRTRDGNKGNAPRELIHLLTAARDAQLRIMEVGGAEPPGETLIDRSALKDALPQVSKVRFEQTLLPEYPQFREVLGKLEREKTGQTPQTLAQIWGLEASEALKIAEQLSEIGFFERRGTRSEPFFWVPFLYRDALSMKQGAA